MKNLTQTEHAYMRAVASLLHVFPPDSALTAPDYYSVTWDGVGIIIFRPSESAIAVVFLPPSVFEEYIPRNRHNDGRPATEEEWMALYRYYPGLPRT